MHKAFINDKPLIFEDVYGDNKNRPENLMIVSDEEISIDGVIKKFEDGITSGVIYLCARPDQAWNDFVSMFTLVEAAGGVVSNDKGELLVIFRKKKWDLPKGKLDYDESPESAAVREVKEECGLKKVELGKFIMKTFHTYIEKNKSILKKTHWFTMNTNDDTKLIPQIEEEIEEARWMNKNEIQKKVFKNTYASIEDVLNTFFANR